MLKDGIGNAVTPGNLVWWHTKALTARVTAVDEPSVLTRDDAQRATVVTLELKVMVPRNPDGTWQTAEFLRVVDPASESILDAIGGGKPQ
jgi:hypothetical protein